MIFTVCDKSAFGIYAEELCTKVSSKSRTKVFLF